MEKIPNKKVQWAQFRSMQANVEAMAKQIIALSNIKFNANSAKTVGIDFSNAMEDLDLQQACNRYRWGRLPDNLQSWQIEEMLYYQSVLTGFFKGGVMYILPFSARDGVNVVGSPNAVLPVTFNGALAGDFSDAGFGKLLVANDGSINPNAQCALLYDKIPRNTNGGAMSRWQINKSLREAQADILGRIEQNLQNISQKVVFYVDSEAQQRQMESDLDQAFGSDKPYVIVVRGTTGIDDRKDGQAQTLQGNIQNETQALFEAYQSFNSIRCGLLGIQNGGAFEKKERKITAEADDQAEQTNLVADGGLYMRKLFLAQMKVIYPQYANILNKIKVYRVGGEEDPNVKHEDGEMGKNLDIKGENEQ